MKYPIGQQDFPSIREEGKVYVDKTRIIYELVNNSKYVFLARPRRFGKSLLLSTIKAFFEGRKDLFHGLAVEALEKDWVRRPVFLLELSRVNPRSHDSLKELLNQQFSLWEEELGIVNSNKDFGSRFATILIKSYDKHHQKAIVLVDEYDNPLINTLGDDRSLVHDQNRELLKSVYSNLKALDSHICFGMLTGVSRFSKMSIFSGLNNLEDISFNPDYASICGFTQDEITNFLGKGIESMSETNNLSLDSTLQKLKQQYDGYHFTRCSPDIYNPYSLLLSLHKKVIGNYWFESATPSFLAEELKSSTLPFTKIFNAEAKESTMAEPDSSFRSPIALLYQTGYLTIKDFSPRKNRYVLGIPNREVEDSLFPYLLNAFTRIDSSAQDIFIEEMKDALNDGKPEEFLQMLRSYLADVPTFSTENKITEKYSEHALYLVFKTMGFDITSQKSTSYGRIDLVLKTLRYIYVMELKLNRDSQEALDQIENKEYTLPYNFDKRKIFQIGLNFSSATRNLSSWQIK